MRMHAEKLNVKDISGLYVNEVLPNSGAAAAGIQKGDIIKKVDGASIYDSPDLQEKIGRLSPGDKVQLTYSRNGQMKNATVTLKGENSAAKPNTIAKAEHQYKHRKIRCFICPCFARA